VEADIDNVFIDPIDSECLFGLLDGLPLAIAQAGAYLQESGVGLETYLRLYKQQWKELMEARGRTETLLQDYPDRSVWTTWAISYNAIREKDEATANLLLLWSFLDNKDLWYGLFAEACKASTTMARMLSEWIGDIARKELDFIQAMQLLRNYSMIEEVEDVASYATHIVVHKWAYHYRGQDCYGKIALLALAVVGHAIPETSTRDYWTLHRRLLPHVQACSQWVIASDVNDEYKLDSDRTDEKEVMLDAIHQLGCLHKNQGKLGDAEKMCMRALQGKVVALGPKHISTLNTLHNLGGIFQGQGKLGEAEKMYMRALEGYEEALGPKHTGTLETVNNIGFLFQDQGKLREAEKMYIRAMEGFEEELGPKHISTLYTLNNLGTIFKDQGKLGEAEKMYIRALEGKEQALGPKHTSTLDTVHNLAILYRKQGKPGEALKMYKRALEGYEEALGPKHISTMDTVNCMGLLYADQGKLEEAEKMYMRALQGYQEALGPETVARYRPALNTMSNLGRLFASQGEPAKAKAMYTRALAGFQASLGPSSGKCHSLERAIASLDLEKGKI